MVRHIVAWNHKEGDQQQRQEVALRIKQGLEGLAAEVPGVVEIRVETALLPTSTHALLLNSTFENEEALAAYQQHPAHKQVGALIKETMHQRVCVDYHVD
ncbi:Dabb family protein [Ruminococcaceae bacterium OttesenSCG-928-O06]|nr:Dabb family protein [Ruminococcaceae bacterium OttesenSCG-928-O06]